MPPGRAENLHKIDKLNELKSNLEQDVNKYKQLKDQLVAGFENNLDLTDFNQTLETAESAKNKIAEQIDLTNKYNELKTLIDSSQDLTDSERQSASERWTNEFSNYNTNNDNYVEFKEWLDARIAENKAAKKSYRQAKAAMSDSINKYRVTNFNTAKPDHDEIVAKLESIMKASDEYYDRGFQEKKLDKVAQTLQAIVNTSNLYADNLVELNLYINSKTVNASQAQKSRQTFVDATSEVRTKLKNIDVNMEFINSNKDKLIDRPVLATKQKVFDESAYERTRRNHKPNSGGYEVLVIPVYSKDGSRNLNQLAIRDLSQYLLGYPDVQVTFDLIGTSPLWARRGVYWSENRYKFFGSIEFRTPDGLVKRFERIIIDEVQGIN